VKVIWTSRARRQRSDIWDYIAADSPAAADRMDDLFDDATRRLATFPNMGKAGLIEGTRELLAHKSYRMVYEVSDDAVVILALVHTARQWPPGKHLDV